MNNISQFILRHVLSMLCSRLSILIMNILGIIYCCYVVSVIIPLLWSAYTPKMVVAMTSALDGIGTVFVALGVFYGQRETILVKIAKAKPQQYDAYLNRVAHENGLLLLVLGLLIEIITISIETPNSILDTSRVEYGLLLISMLLVAFSILIQVDLLKDYVKTFFKKEMWED